VSAELANYPVAAPALRPPVLFDQRWCSVAFVHWPVRPERVAGMFPPGTRPDVYADGFTYVGLVPFEMRAAGFGAARPVPYFGNFLETNIRLYSVDDADRHGVLFRSLDCSRLAMVPSARATLGIPYTWSRIRLQRDEDVVRYDCTRRLPRRGLRSHLVVRVGGETAATDLEVWLTARWGAHTRIARRTVWVPNEHDAWPVHSAEILELRDELLWASGVPIAGEALRAMWSPGVRTRFGRPSLVH
jgi:uncharacterized protein YqjF (DUF2071 family)